MTLRRNPESEKNIKRIDSKRTHGFQVYFKRENVEYTRFFGDGINGGKEAALIEARCFREILRESIPPSKTGSPACPGPARSNTGHMGLSITQSILKSGAITVYVEASVRIEKGKTKNRQFQVGDRTLADVIQDALAWRESMIQERIDKEQKKMESGLAITHLA